jgi:hypothetical protein
MGWTLDTSGARSFGVRLSFQSARVVLQNLGRAGGPGRRREQGPGRGGRGAREGGGGKRARPARAGAVPPHLQNFSSCRPACCSCQRARHWGCTLRGHLQGLTSRRLPSSEASSRQIQHCSCSPPSPWVCRPRAERGRGTRGGGGGGASACSADPHCSAASRSRGRLPGAPLPVAYRASSPPAHHGCRPSCRGAPKSRGIPPESPADPCLPPNSYPTDGRLLPRLIRGFERDPHRALLPVSSFLLPASPLL